MGEYDVVIAGAGLGGLCAAAGLMRAGLRVLVLERDANLVSRPQGYRININLAGDAALRVCLSESHFELYRDTSHRQIDPSVDIFSVDLTHLFRRTAEVAAAGPTPTAVDRSVLRTILLDAAGSRRVNDVCFGYEVVDVSSGEDHAEVRLSDGSLIRAGLLVAADGAKSTLRKRLLPGYEPEPLQTVAIYGRSPLDIRALTWLPRGVVEQRFVGVTDGAGTTLALGAWYPRRVPSEAAAAHVPDLKLPAPEPYVMWVLLCPANTAPRPESGPEALHQYALSIVSGWDPAATRFVREAIVPDTFRITLRAMPSVPAWKTQRVTFLGDAIHAMSPAGGEGANTALADAASLVSCLKDSGMDGLFTYERDLRQRAREALGRSAKYGRTTGQELAHHA